MKGTNEILEAAQRVCRELAASPSSEEQAWPEGAIRALQRAGLGGLVVPTTFGGLGGGLYELTRVCELLGAVDGSTAICFGMHAVASACLSVKASADQVQRYLRPIVDGQHFTTLALSEPESGSHFYLPTVAMELFDPQTYEVNGTKSFVTNGGHADSYLVSTAVAGAAADPGYFSMVMIPGGAPGLSWGAPWSGWGMRANSSRSLELGGVKVPVGDRLGEEGDQIWYVFNVVAPYFLTAMAGTYLGIAGRAVTETIEHLKQRRYGDSGKSLAELDILQHRLGTLWAELQRTRQLCYWAAREGDEDGADALPAVCAAKAEVGTAAVHIVNECMTLLGGMAYRDGSVLHRLLRDARAAHVMSPTTDMLYPWVGRALLGLPLLGE